MHAHRALWKERVLLVGVLINVFFLESLGSTLPSQGLHPHPLLSLFSTGSQEKILFFFYWRNKGLAFNDNPSSVT